MAGNVGCSSTRRTCPQCALASRRLARKADGCFQTLLVGSGAVEAILRRDPRVAAATDQASGRPIGGRYRR